MDIEDKNYIEGVKDVLGAVSAALDDLQDQLDQAEISVMADDSVDLDEIARKCGMDETTTDSFGA